MAVAAAHVAFGGCSRTRCLVCACITGCMRVGQSVDAGDGVYGGRQFDAESSCQESELVPQGQKGMLHVACAETLSVPPLAPSQTSSHAWSSDCAGHRKGAGVSALAPHRAFGHQVGECAAATVRECATRAGCELKLKLQQPSIGHGCTMKCRDGTAKLGDVGLAKIMAGGYVSGAVGTLAW